VEIDARGDQRRVRVDGLAQLEIAYHAAVGSPFVSKSSESGAEFEQGDFKI
jgi:hypothetical protein